MVVEGIAEGGELNTTCPCREVGWACDEASDSLKAVSNWVRGMIGRAIRLTVVLDASAADRCGGRTCRNRAGDSCTWHLGYGSTRADVCVQLV